MQIHNYTKYKDETGRPIKNLWQRNGRLYAQISIKGKSGRYPLEAKTATLAISEVEKIKEELRTGLRLFPGDEPRLAIDEISLKELNKLYFGSHGYDWEKGETRAKKASDYGYTPNGSKKDWKTLKNERGHMRVLLKFFPDLNAASITAETLKEISVKSAKYKNPRRKNNDVNIKGVCGATVDNRIITLGNLLKYGVEQKLLSKLPVPRQKRPQRYTAGAKVKYLLSRAQIDLLIEKAGSPPKEPRKQLLFDLALCDGPAKALGYVVFEPAVAVTGLVNTDTLAERYGVSDVTIRNLKNRGVFPYTLGFQTVGPGSPFYDTIVKARAMFVDYLKLLRYSGAREHESSVLRWENVDFETGFLCFPSHIQKKGGGWRHEDRYTKMNPPLRRLLEDLRAKRNGNCPWLFPSLYPDNFPTRENPEGEPQTRWDQQWERVNTESGLQLLTGQRIDANHMRHFFITRCIMAGKPAFTVAKWVGNSLKMIQKVYGHLIDEYEARHATELEGQL